MRYRHQNLLDAISSATAHVMQKMKAGSIAHLVRISERLQAHPGEQGSTSTGEGSTRTEDQGPT